MKQQLNAIERKVIDVLIEHEPTSTQYGALPAVERVLDPAGTIEARRFVDDLVSRELIHISQKVHDGRPYQEPEWFWEEGRL